MFASLRFIHRQCNSIFKSQNVTSILLPSNQSILLNLSVWYEMLILLIRTLSVSSLNPNPTSSLNQAKSFCLIEILILLIRTPSVSLPTPFSYFFIHRQCNSLFKSQNVTSILLPSNKSILLNLLDWYKIIIRVIRTLSVSSLNPVSYFFIE